MNKRNARDPLRLQRDFLRRLAHPAEVIALFDYLPRVNLFIKDREHRFVKANRGEWLMHGCSSESEMIGKTDFDLHPPALAAQYVEEDRKVMHSRRVLPDQAWLVMGADGMPRWYLCTKLPLTDAAGEVIGIAGVMRPLEQAGDAPGEYRRLTPAIDFVFARYGERITVRQMAERSHLSVSHLQREFRRLFDISPSGYLLRVRLLMARRALEQSNDSIGNIAIGCGFFDQSHFTRAFRQATGMRPLEYRRQFTAASPEYSVK